MPGEVTQLLAAFARGDREAWNQLVPLVYQELRLIARRQLAQEQNHSSLQPTALVHEAWIRLKRAGKLSVNNSQHFLAVAATAMRRVIVDGARSRQAVKRGGGASPVDIAKYDFAMPLRDDQLVQLNVALEELAALDPLQSTIIELRFFVGLEIEEAAKVVGLPKHELEREWRFARAWLKNQLG